VALNDIDTGPGQATADRARRARRP